MSKFRVMGMRVFGRRWNDGVELFEYWPASSEWFLLRVLLLKTCQRMPQIYLSPPTPYRVLHIHAFGWSLSFARQRRAAG